MDLEQQLKSASLRLVLHTAATEGDRIVLEEAFYQDVRSFLATVYRQVGEGLESDGTLAYIVRQAAEYRALYKTHGFEHAKDDVTSALRASITRQMEGDITRSAYSHLYKWLRATFELGGVTALRAMGFDAESPYLTDLLDRVVVAKAAGDPLIFELTDRELLHALESRARLFGAGITEDVIEDSRKILRDNVFRGNMGTHEAGRMIADAHGIPEWRGVKIARTETQISYNLAMYSTYKRSGVQRHSWLTVGDSRVRPLHAMNGESGPVNIGEPFPDGSLHPGDGPSPFNCRCTLEPDLSDPNILLEPWNGDEGMYDRLPDFTGGPWAYSSSIAHAPRPDVTGMKLVEVREELRKIMERAKVAESRIMQGLRQIDSAKMRQIQRDFDEIDDLRGSKAVTEFLKERYGISVIKAVTGDLPHLDDLVVVPLPPIIKPVIVTPPPPVIIKPVIVEPVLPPIIRPTGDPSTWTLVQVRDEVRLIMERAKVADSRIMNALRQLDAGKMTQLQKEIDAFRRLDGSKAVGEFLKDRLGISIIKQTSGELPNLGGIVKPAVIKPVVVTPPPVVVKPPVQSIAPSPSGAAGTAITRTPAEAIRHLDKIDDVYDPVHFIPYSNPQGTAMADAVLRHNNYADVKVTQIPIDKIVGRDQYLTKKQIIARIHDLEKFGKQEYIEVFQLKGHVFSRYDHDYLIALKLSGATHVDVRLVVADDLVEAALKAIADRAALPKASTAIIPEAQRPALREARIKAGLKPGKEVRAELLKSDTPRAKILKEDAHIVAKYGDDMATQGLVLQMRLEKIASVHSDDEEAAAILKLAKRIAHADAVGQTASAKDIQEAAEFLMRFKEEATASALSVPAQMVYEKANMYIRNHTAADFYSEAESFFKRVLPKDMAITPSGVSHNGVTNKTHVDVYRHGASYRGNFQAGVGVVNLSSKRDVNTLVHEVGHFIEVRARSPVSNRRLVDITAEFWEKRTKGESFQHMGPGYGAREMIKEDKFIDRYMGKVYDSSGGCKPYGASDIRATEILSMGLEMLYHDPVKLARTDPEFFDFMIDLIRGLL